MSLLCYPIRSPTASKQKKGTVPRGVVVRYTEAYTMWVGAVWVPHICPQCARVYTGPDLHLFLSFQKIDILKAQKRVQKAQKGLKRPN